MCWALRDQTKRDPLAHTHIQPVSSRVDRASATEMVDSGSISGRVEPKNTKNWY